MAPTTTTFVIANSSSFNSTLNSYYAMENFTLYVDDPKTILSTYISTTLFVNEGETQYLISKSFLNIPGYAIAIISWCTVAIILLQCIRFMYIRFENPIKYNFLLKIKPLSLNLLRYIQIFDIFILISQSYLIAACIFSWHYLSDYCEQFDDKIVTECSINQYCNLSDNNNSCNTSTKSIIFMLIAYFLAFIGIFVIAHKISTLLDYREFFKVNTNAKNNWEHYQRAFVTVDCNDCLVAFMIVAWNICVWTELISFFFLFETPNIKYIEWYILFPLFGIWLFNEVMIKGIYYKTHWVYKPEKHIQYLIRSKFGHNVSEIILAYIGLGEYRSLLDDDDKQIELVMMNDIDNEIKDVDTWIGNHVIHELETEEESDMMFSEMLDHVRVEYGNNNGINNGINGNQKQRMYYNNRNMVYINMRQQISATTNNQSDYSDYYPSVYEQ